jgi:hypothetical protein
MALGGRASSLLAAFVQDLVTGGPFKSFICKDLWL